MRKKGMASQPNWVKEDPKKAWRLGEEEGREGGASRVKMGMEEVRDALQKISALLKYGGFPSSQSAKVY